MGESVHTKQDRPLKLVSYLSFDSENKAIEFEKYIKVGSGHAFAKKKFGNQANAWRSQLFQLYNIIRIPMKRNVLCALLVTMSAVSLSAMYQDQTVMMVDGKPVLLTQKLRNVSKLILLNKLDTLIALILFDKQEFVWHRDVLMQMCDDAKYRIWGISLEYKHFGMTNAQKKYSERYEVMRTILDKLLIG